MAPQSLWSTLPLFLLLAPALAIENNFDFYPANSQDCLYESANNAGCTSGTLSKLNTCLCGNNNDFVINTAKCLGKKDSADVGEVYTRMSDACQNSNTPLSVTKKEFQDAANEAENGSSSTDAAASTTETASATKQSDVVTTTTGGKTVTVVPTQTSDSKDDSNSTGLSTGVTIGIGVGAAAIGAAAVSAVVFFLLRRRRRKGEESHPMLPNSNYNNTSTYPPTDPALGMGFHENKPPAWAGGATPSPDPSKGWQTPSPNPYVGAYVPPQAAPPQPQVFEMDGGTPHPGAQGGAVEMPAQQGWQR